MLVQINLSWIFYPNHPLQELFVGHTLSAHMASCYIYSGEQDRHVLTEPTGGQERL